LLDGKTAYFVKWCQLLSQILRCFSFNRRYLFLLNWFFVPKHSIPLPVLFKDCTNHSLIYVLLFVLFATTDYSYVITQLSHIAQESLQVVLLCEEQVSIDAIHGEDKGNPRIFCFDFLTCICIDFFIIQKLQEANGIILVYLFVIEKTAAWGHFVLGDDVGIVAYDTT
jgi:hypothetical protein